MENNYNIIMMEPSKIKPYNRNARKNDETVMKLCEIIPKVGFNQPIVIDKNNVIVKGHSRWKAAIKLGLDKIPVIISENSDEVNKLDRLSDNKIQEFSQWDNSILGTELASINVDDIQLEDFGFDLDQFTEPMKFEEKIIDMPEIPEMPHDEQKENETTQISRYEPQQNKEATITEDDILKTVATNKNNYGSVTCPKCGQVVLYKK